MKSNLILKIYSVVGYFAVRIDTRNEEAFACVEHYLVEIVGRCDGLAVGFGNYEAFADADDSPHIEHLTGKEAIELMKQREQS